MGNWEFHPVFPFCFSASIVAAYIFTAPTCKATIISLESCALNADFQSISFPDLIKFPYFMDTPWKKSLGWKEAQREGDFTNNFNIYTLFKNFNSFTIHFSVACQPALSTFANHSGWLWERNRVQGNSAYIHDTIHLAWCASGCWFTLADNFPKCPKSIRDMSTSPWAIQLYHII